MKSVINSFFVAFSMYSAIPLKKDIVWNKNTMKFSLCFLPLIGLIIGAAEILWLFLCIKFVLDKNLYSSVSVILPIIISGGIHMDGFIDTADAYFSYSDTEKKLEILKDSHIGAFCVIYYAVLILCEFGFYSQIYSDVKYKYILMFAFVLSRSLGGRLIVDLDCAKNSGLAKIFSDNSDKKTVSIILSAVSGFLFVLEFYFYKFFAVIMFFASLLFYISYKKMCNLKFGGITGDLAGCFIVLTEFMIIAFCCFGGAFN